MMNKFSDRIAPLIVAAALLIYLSYDLFVHGEVFNGLHLGAFALIALLVLAPFAARIKIPNIIELETKLDKLRKETDQEISQLRNTIASVTNVRVNPVLNQYTFLGSEKELKQMAEAVKSTPGKDEIVAENGGIESERVRFINQTRLVLDNAQMILKQARVIQIAYEEKRQFEAVDLGPEDPLERTKFLINCMVQGGLKLFVPEGEQAAIIKELETVRKLVIIYGDVYNRTTKPPSVGETDKIVKAVGNVMNLISASVAFLAGSAVEAQRRIAEAIPYFKRGEMPPF